MHPRYSPIDDIRRLQEWKTFQPKTCFLGFAVPELPRLNNLVWLAPAARHQADGVLDSDLLDVGVGEQHEQVYRLYLLCLLILPPSSTTDGETSTRRKGNHHVPLIGVWQQSIPSVTYDMVSIHAPRVGGDGVAIHQRLQYCCFNPRPPRGGRLRPRRG